ncbi:hypothetical protein P2Q74_25640, partial [Escherichia coli]
FRIPFAITAVSLIADIAAENSTITLHTLLVVGDIRIMQISCCWGMTGTTSPDVVKSRRTTRNGAAVSMAGVSSIAPENAPGCQVDHTLK